MLCMNELEFSHLWSKDCRGNGVRYVGASALIDVAVSFCQELWRDPPDMTITSFVRLLTITTRLLPLIKVGIRRIRR